MVTRNTPPPTLDSWLAQAVSGSTNYGNGSTAKITVGPSSSSSATYKGRGVFEIPLQDAATGLNVFNGWSAVTSANLKIKVAGNTCAVRGSTQRIFLEQLTGTFGQNAPSGDCTLSSTGTSDKRWPGPSATTTNRVLFTASNPATDSTLTVSIDALIQAAYANGDTVFRFRLIAANAAGDGYDEANTNRTITFYSSKSAGNEPYIEVNGTTTSTTAKNMSLAIAATFAMSVSISGTPTVSVDGERAIIPMTQQNTTVTAILNSVSTRDVDSDMLWSADAVPVGAVAAIRTLARAIDKDNHYRISARIQPDASFELRLSKNVAGVVTDFATLPDAGISFSPDALYHLELSAVGASPTVLRARLWLHVTSAPDWMLTASDSEASLQVAEAVGAAVTVNAVTNLPITFAIEEYNTLPG